MTISHIRKLLGCSYTQAHAVYEAYYSKEAAYRKASRLILATGRA